MHTMPEQPPEWTLWGTLIGACIFLFKWLAPKINLRAGLAWLNEPTMRPLHAKVDRIMRVIDKMPGAEDAHAAIRAEDAKDHLNWE